jgi:hypothetical protein
MIPILEKLLWEEFWQQAIAERDFAAEQWAEAETRLAVAEAAWDSISIENFELRTRLAQIAARQAALPAPTRPKRRALFKRRTK